MPDKLETRDMKSKDGLIKERAKGYPAAIRELEEVIEGWKYYFD